jgi:hypothetical protein
MSASVHAALDQLWCSHAHTTHKMHTRLERVAAKGETTNTDKHTATTLLCSRTCVRTLTLSLATSSTAAFTASIFCDVCDATKISTGGCGIVHTCLVPRESIEGPVVLRLCHVSYSDRVPSPAVLLDLDVSTPARVPDETSMYGHRSTAVHALAVSYMKIERSIN